MTIHVVIMKIYYSFVSFDVIGGFISREIIYKARFTVRITHSQAYFIRLQETISKIYIGVCRLEYKKTNEMGSESNITYQQVPATSSAKVFLKILD